MTRPGRGMAHYEWELTWWALVGTCWCHGYTDEQLRVLMRDGHVRDVVDIHAARHGREDR